MMRKGPSEFKLEIGWPFFGALGRGHCCALQRQFAQRPWTEVDVV
jgi:hypothetical protein